LFRVPSSTPRILSPELAAAFAERRLALSRGSNVRVAQLAIPAFAPDDILGVFCAANEGDRIVAELVAAGIDTFVAPDASDTD
jgi:hypothetical protein